MATTWAQERAKIKAQGFILSDPTPTYRPGGYPRLGLAPLHTELSSRSTTKLRTQLERAEHELGNLRFQALGLTRMDALLANELASVYLGLREKYRGVWVDQVNFCSTISDLDGGTLACATSTSLNTPTLHHLAFEVGSVDVREILNHLHQSSDQFDAKVIASAKQEARTLGPRAGRRDLASHGAIDISECFSHPRCYGTLQTYWEIRNYNSDIKGQPLRLVENMVSEAAFVMIHEFGHLVETAVLSQGEEAYALMLEALEDGLLRDENGRWLVKDKELREAGLTRRDARLANYPAYSNIKRGEGAKRKAVRDVAGAPIGYALGSYARRYRDELIAEAFALAITAKDPELRARLAPFRQVLVDVGIARTRR